MENPAETDRAQREDMQFQAGALDSMLRSPGWSVARPILEGRLKFLLAQLLDPSRARERAASDDYIRGQIEALALILKTPLDMFERYDKLVREAEQLAASAQASDPWSEMAATFGIRRSGYPEDGSNPTGQPGEGSN